MRYIQRDVQGKVVAHFAHWHNYATEEVPDDHPDILAWYADRERAKTAAPGAEARIAVLEAELARLAKIVDKNNGR